MNNLREIQWKPGDKVRHFKGNTYEIVCICKDSDDLSNKIVYRDLSDDTKIWVRSLHEFNSKVDKVKYPDVAQTYRFEKLD